MPNDKDHKHSAVAPALGYYFQAYYALIELFKAEEDDAFVSIESWDDVYFEDGDQKVLHQLKHTINPNAKIGIKSRELWTTLNIWCDYCKKTNPVMGQFVLATVADVDSSSPLSVLSVADSPRAELLNELIKEAETVKKKRKEKRKNGVPVADLPYKERYQGCYAFLDLDEKTQINLVANIKHRKGMWTIDQCLEKIVEIVAPTCPSKMRKPLAKRILEWWNRIAIESLLAKRARGIYSWELKQFVAEMASQLIDDGITDDMAAIEVPNDLLPEGVMKTQLEVIDASANQINRSLRTEWRARYQRNIWIEDNPAIESRLTKYSDHLVEEWQDRWQEMREMVRVENTAESQKKLEGRKLLDWSHYNAPKDVRPIKTSWNNHDLVRGTYQILSKDLSVGWHPEFISLVKTDDPEGE